MSKLISPNVLRAQRAMNKLFGKDIPETGQIDMRTRKAFVNVLKRCLNVAFGDGLDIENTTINEKTRNAIMSCRIGRRDVSIAVTLLEIELSLLNYYDGEIKKPDAYHLYSNVSSFQSDHGLDVTGEVDGQTMMCIISKISV